MASANPYCQIRAKSPSLASNARPNTFQSNGKIAAGSAAIFLQLKPSNTQADKPRRGNDRPQSTQFQTTAKIKSGAINNGQTIQDGLTHLNLDSIPYRKARA